MKVNGRDYRTVWMEDGRVFLIDQVRLPFEFRLVETDDHSATCECIRNMTVRGAGAIGAAAGFAMAQAFRRAPAAGFDAFVEAARREIRSTRPTAQNLFYAVDRVFGAAAGAGDPAKAAAEAAQAVADEDAACSRRIGELGADLIADGAGVETHCNAGWLAFVDYGTALSPVYHAHAAGKRLLVYADETRPRGQGARLTAWELRNAGVPHVIIPDTAGAWLMSRGKIDLVIVGADRIAANGDTANKIGTLEKALCAKAYGIPFYVAAPTSTIDPACATGADIPIEERPADEVLWQTGPTRDGRMETVRVCAPGSTALNPAFDVTPADCIAGIVTEKGIVRPGAAAIRATP